MATNNIPFDFGNLEVVFAGQSLALDAFTGLSYSWSRAVGEMRGRGNQLLALSDGKVTIDEITLTVSRSAYESIIDLFGFDSWQNAGVAGVTFDLVVTDTHPASGTTLKRTFEGCTPTGDSISYSEGEEVTTVEVKMKCLRITK